jgi:hypothetical protein
MIDHDGSPQSGISVTSISPIERMPDTMKGIELNDRDKALYQAI